MTSGVVPRRLGDRRRRARRVAHHRQPYGRPLPGRLHHHRPAELELDRRPVSPAPSASPRVATSAHEEQPLREVLVHRHRAAQRPRPGITHAGQLEQVLDRAVLAAAAVERQEDHVGRRGWRGSASSPPSSTPRSAAMRAGSRRRAARPATPGEQRVFGCGVEHPGGRVDDRHLRAAGSRRRRPPTLRASAGRDARTHRRSGADASRRIRHGVDALVAIASSPDHQLQHVVARHDAHQLAVVGDQRRGRSRGSASARAGRA